MVRDLQSDMLQELYHHEDWRIYTCTYLQQWLIHSRADGENSFPEGCRLVFTGGDLMDGPVDGVPVPCVRAGEEWDVTVELKAPTVSGRYLGYWRMKWLDNFFGHRLWADIRVRIPVAVAHVNHQVSCVDFGLSA
jgi:hypothetical protein